MHIKSKLFTFEGKILKSLAALNKTFLTPGPKKANKQEEYKKEYKELKEDLENVLKEFQKEAIPIIKVRYIRAVLYCTSFVAYVTNALAYC